MPFSSLKYSIAITIFLLELVMLSLVLWQTQSASFEKSATALSKNDGVIEGLLTEISHTSLLTTEFDTLQPYFQQATSTEHVELVFLADHRNIIVASSDTQLFGSPVGSLSDDNDSYWRHQNIENSSGTVGTLHIRFSNQELKQASRDTLQLGIVIALTGMFIIAIAGFAMGTLLTRRLQRLSEHARIMSSGDLEKKIHIEGRDEVAELANALNTMTEKVSSSFSQIKHMAYHDGLTGLANRHEFNNKLQRAIESATRQNNVHALMFLDLDQFKVVNDTSGHDAGDALLMQLAKVLHLQLRPEDTLARLGGDEFGVLMENCTTDVALERAERIRSSVEAFQFDWHGKRFNVGVSIGIVAITKQTPNLKKLLSIADMACYAAKDKGRNTIHLALDDDSAIDRRAAEMNWVPRIQSALDEHRLSVFYQRIANTQNPETRPFCEFLVRLNEPNGDLVLPDIFLPAAERFGLITAIDREVVNIVFSMLANCHNHKPELAFINLSGKSMTDPDFHSYIEQKLALTGIPPNAICFEITETVAIHNFEAAVNFINSIRALGCKFALDDFGSGMCSFTYLKQLPVDFVKIDGSFILNMLENKVDKQIIASINQIAHDSNFLTIAEFVETPEQLRSLQEIGVDFVQGYAIHTHQAVTQDTDDDDFTAQEAP